MIRKVAFVLLVFYLLYADAYFTSQAVRDRFWAIAGGGIYERGRVYDEPPRFKESRVFPMSLVP